MNLAGQLEVLTKDEMQMVHEKACELLANKGVVFQSEKASMLEEIYAYAKEHHYDIAEPMFLRYLVTFRENGVRTHAYEAYVPLK